MTYTWRWWIFSKHLHTNVNVFWNRLTPLGVIIMVNCLLLLSPLMSIFRLIYGITTGFHSTIQLTIGWSLSSGWTCDNTSVNTEKPSAYWVALEGSALVDPLTTNRLNTWNRCLLGNIPLSFTLHFSSSSHSTHNNYSNCDIPYFLTSNSNTVIYFWRLLSWMLR